MQTGRKGPQMTDKEEIALGIGAYELALEVRKGMPPDIHLWPERDRELYWRGWRDALMCALSNYEEMYNRIQPQDAAKLN
jgi:hypothetical protein